MKWVIDKIVELIWEAVKPLIKPFLDRHADGLRKKALPLYERFWPRKFAIEELIRKGEFTRGNGPTHEQFVTRVKSGDSHFDVVRLFLKAGIKLDLLSKDDTTALLTAIKHGQRRTVELLVEHNANVYQKNGCGVFPLEASILTRQQRVRKTLLDRISLDEAARNEQERYANRAHLVVAVEKCNQKRVKNLITDSVDVDDARNMECETPLMVAARYGHLSIAKTLLNVGANPYVFSPHGETAITIATKNGDGRMVGLLSGWPAPREKPEKDGRLDALMIAITRGDNVILEILLKNGAEPNAKDETEQTPLLHASRLRRADIVVILLSHGANIDDCGPDEVTPLIAAAYAGRAKVVETLLKAKSRPDVDATDVYGRTAIKAAVLNRDEIIAEILRKAGATKGEKEARLILAAEGEDSDFVRTLLDQGVDANACRRDRRSALMVASEIGHKKVVKELLDSQKVEVDACDADGRTALMLAAGRVHADTDIVELLVGAGAEVNASRPDGSTALMEACRHGHAEVARILLAAGARVNAKMKDGRTALYLTLENAKIDRARVVARILVDAGAKVKVKTKPGQTALMMSLLRRDSTTEHLLREKGGKKGELEVDLFTAAVSGDAREVERLIMKGAKVSAARMLGKTLLTAVAERGHLGVVKVLVKAGADVNVQGEDFSTALEKAAERGREQVVKYLIAAGADVDKRGKENRTALMAALEKRHGDTARVLITRGANVNARDDYGCSALMVATLQGLSSIEALLEKRGASEGKKEAQLILASEQGQLDRIKQWVRVGANVNARSRSERMAILGACASGTIKAVQFLINRNADINVRGSNDKTPLTVATRKGSSRLAGVLIEAGANVNAIGDSGQTALMIAAVAGRTTLVKQLLDSGSDVNAQSTDGDTSLILAVQNGPTNIVQMLLKRGAKVNAKGNRGQTALMCAAKRNYGPLISVLINCGADVDAKNKDGSTSLIQASTLGKYKAVHILVQNGNKPDLDATDTFGNTPLMGAIVGGHGKIVKLLRQEGAQAGEKEGRLIIAVRREDEDIVTVTGLLMQAVNVDARIGDGDSALIEAIYRRHSGIANLLVGEGANVNLKGVGGRTALMGVAQSGDNKLVELLVDKGACDTIEAVQESGDGQTLHTAMTLADSNGHKDISDFLVDHCAALKPKSQVFTAKFGNCYHLQGCTWLRYEFGQQSMETALSDGLRPCKACIKRQ